MEITTTFTLEVTVIEKNVPERRLPYRAADETTLRQRVKDMLNADDVILSDLKQFELNEKGNDDAEDQDRVD